MDLFPEEGDLGAIKDRPHSVEAGVVDLRPTRDRACHVPVVTLRIGGEVRNVDGAAIAAL
jgi:hypothetical protein